MRLLLDLDGVCADLFPAWIGLYNKDYNDDVKLADITEWDTHKFVKPECGKKLYDYLNAPRLFYSLVPLPGCAEVVERLCAKGHDIIITTSVPNNAETGEFDKKAWVKKHLPFLPKHNFVSTHRKDTITGDLLFDDGPHNIRAFPGLTCVFDYPYNRNVYSNYRVNSWLGFEKVIEGLNK